jgi:hypothetical protein
MFEDMMRGIARDTVRSAMTVEVGNSAQEAEATTPAAPTAPSGAEGSGGRRHRQKQRKAAGTTRGGSRTRRR